MFLVVSNSVGNVSSNHVITWKQQPITSFFDAHSAKVLFENKSSSPVILLGTLSKREWHSLRKQQHIVMSIYFFQFRLLHISTRADSDPLNFLKKEAICFLNRFIYWKLLLTGIRSSEQIEFLMLYDSSTIWFKRAVLRVHYYVLSGLSLLKILKLKNWI